jgi:hypothetical protein
VELCRILKYTIQLSNLTANVFSRADLVQYEKLSKSNAMFNLNHAFNLAEKEFGLVKLLDAGQFLSTITIDGFRYGNLGHRLNQCCGSGSTVSTCFWTYWIRIRIYYSEVWIWLWIRILLSLSKNSMKNLDFYCFVTSF